MRSVPPGHQTAVERPSTLPATRWRPDCYRSGRGIAARARDFPTRIGHQADGYPVASIRGAAARVGGVVAATEALSNCRSTCLNPEYTFLDLAAGEVTVHQSDPDDPNLHHVGATHQRMEYARMWSMTNLSITFGSVDSAPELLFLTEGNDIRSTEKVPLARSVNGTAQRPPKRSDLVVYYPDHAIPKWRHGHMAVVVDAYMEQVIVSLAEKNYDDEPWQVLEHYSRQIRLFQVVGRYTQHDLPAAGGDNPDGGRISGWIYPLESL